MSVTIDLPDHDTLQVSPTTAAELLVQAYGDRADDHDVTGPRWAVEATWAEIDRLLAAR